jgi:hypothetical protein
MNAPTDTPHAERLRRKSLWDIRIDLQVLALEAERIASLGDREALAALATFDRALEGIRLRAEVLGLKEIQK